MDHARPPIEKESLLEFIVKAHQHTYAAVRSIKMMYACRTSILPGHKDYHFVDGDWTYHDSYAEGTGAPGREVVLFRNQPVWCMSYQGQHNESYPEEFFQTKVFPFLQEALRSVTPEMPFRGPARFEKDNFVYTFEMQGDYAYFTGRESITHKGIEIFFQNVMGALIK